MLGSGAAPIDVATSAPQRACCGEPDTIFRVSPVTPSTLSVMLLNA